MHESGTSGSVGGEGGNRLVYPARSPIAVIIDRFAGDRQLFWVYGRYNHLRHTGRAAKVIVKTALDPKRHTLETYCHSVLTMRY